MGMPQIGRFFSLQQGQVGQYLSPRILVVRSPFQPLSRLGGPPEVCYFGFETLAQVQKFAQRLSRLNVSFQIQKRHQLRQFPYEIKLLGHPELARMLAYWERTQHPQGQQVFGLAVGVPGLPVAA